jgi:hypothetical protein
MPFVLPEIVVRKVIDHGMKQLRTNKAAFDDLFCIFLQDELGVDYGEDYREQIWLWFSTTKIPVIQAWSFNAQKIPCISIHLANETEDESKAAMDDLAGSFNQTEETGTAAFTVMIDIGIHANKGGDHVLWLYYIVSYILFKYKPMAFRLGLKLGTFSASDYSKDSAKMGNNIWTRWVRFRCTTQNFWGADPFITVDEVNLDHTIGGNVPASDIAAGLDVVIGDIDPCSNDGLKAGRVGDEDGDEDMNI